MKIFKSVKKSSRFMFNFLYKNKYLKSNFIRKNDGYSTNQMIISLVILGILFTLVVPKFTNSIEFIEVLIAEKYLFKSVRQCQSGLINDNNYPKYNLPPNNLVKGFNRKSRFQFFYSGEEGECKSNLNFNQLSASKINVASEEIDYQLIINLVTGEKTSQGNLPEWLDWWEGQYSPLIPLDDPLIN